MQREYHCLDIAFPNVEFDHYLGNRDVKFEASYHTHLYILEDKIELHFFYPAGTEFGRSLISWITKIDKPFGSYVEIKVSSENANKNLLGVDIKNAESNKSRWNSAFYDGTNEYVIIEIDRVVCIWNPLEENANTAEFFLDDNGFQIVKPFYKLLHKHGTSLEIKYDGCDEFFDIEKSKFRPEFTFITKDKQDSRDIVITKEPKIQFSYPDEITLDKAIKYGDVFLMLASFYYHQNINYKFQKIYLTDRVVTIKTIEKKNDYSNEQGGLIWFGIGNFNAFLKKNWQEKTLENFQPLSKAIRLFCQSQLLEDSAKFLIYYNIIEVLDKQKQDVEEFSFNVKKKCFNANAKKALNGLLDMVAETDRKEFEQQLDFAINNLRKPMRSQLDAFLCEQNLSPEEKDIDTNMLRKLRNNITHGSLNKVDKEQLQKANRIMYRIVVVVILNQMGITDWKLSNNAFG